MRRGELGRVPGRFLTLLALAEGEHHGDERGGGFRPERRAEACFESDCNLSRCWRVKQPELGL